MTDVAAPQPAEETTSTDTLPAPRVKVLVDHVEGADLSAALATIERQVYEGLGSVEVVADGSADIPDGVDTHESLEAAIAAVETDFDYVWLIHADARPRPDALRSLVDEVERREAALGGSKILVAGTPGVLEAIGSATDVFGEPYSGLDEGEIDLQQYDVVREVAFVSSVSMLIRRDVAQGLGGVDKTMPPGAAGLDFSQRVRLAGGSVLIVPSSEVYHQGRCGERRGWREEAGRDRAMFKAYSLLTLAWVVPFGLIVDLIDALASLVLLRWRPLVGHVLAIGWNLVHLPSSIVQRRRVGRVRAVGDEELFRFQARGSIRLRAIGSDLSDRVLFMFDEDQGLVRGSRRIWSSPGIWGALGSLVVILIAARSIFFTGVPNVGFSFPFESPTTALDRFLGGWNDSGLGTGAPVHPSVGLTGVVSFLWFGAEGAARTLLTLAFSVIGVVGMGRLAGRLGYRGPGRYLSGFVLLAGPGTALLVGRGSWLALGGAAILPWAVRSVFLHDTDLAKSWFRHVGWVIFWSVVLAALSPMLAFTPLLVAIVWTGLGGTGVSWRLVAISLVSVVAFLGFVLGDPGWLTDQNRLLALSADLLWPVLIVVAALPALISKTRTRLFAGMGAIVSLGSLALAALGAYGPGVEEAALVAGSFGAAIVVAAAFERVGRDPFRWIGALAAGALLVLSVGSLGDGRLGLPAGDENARFEFASTLAGPGGPGRILVISADRSLVPGEAIPGPGLWYRTLDGAGTTIDEVWLPEPAMGDEELAAAVGRIASGAELRPGSLLDQFAIEWVVITGGPDYLEDILEAQLDLVPTPLDPGSQVYGNPSAVPIAFEGLEVWARDGADFIGEPRSGRTALSLNYDEGWRPESGQVDWYVTVSAEEGRASFASSGMNRLLPILATTLLAFGLGLVLVGRLRS